jgi:hypothetical protein
MPISGDYRREERRILSLMGDFSLEGAILRALSLASQNSFPEDIA